jgi:hypothetical protein
MSNDPKTISPLRQRMIEDMRLRKLGEHTQTDYIRAVRTRDSGLARPWWSSGPTAESAVILERLTPPGGKTACSRLR